MSALEGKRIGFFGAGNMAEALARALMAAGVSAETMAACDVAEARRKLFSGELGIETTNDNRRVMEVSDICIFAVKPQDVSKVLAIISPAPADKLFISICAGVTTSFIEKQLSGRPRVVRAMPNTAMLVGAGAAAITPGRWAGEEDVAAARAIFETAAKVVPVEEGMMDAVTAVSGSGPAYFFYLVEAMAQAGEALGLTPDAAAALARQTAVGAGKLLAETDEDATDLREKVTSPGGTTYAALTKMKEKGFAQLVREALEAAAARSKELGR